MTQQDSRELKNCPFCGGEGEITYIDNDESCLQGYYPRCSKCSINDDCLFSDKESAAESWNIRAQSADTALLQQVREDFTQYANHKPECLYWNHATGDLCNCGFKKALQRINERLGV